MFIAGVVYASIAIFKTSYAPGWDSYFYIVQVKSWVEIGTLHSERYNLIYPLLYLIHFFTLDYVLSYKLLTILSFSSFPIIVYKLLNALDVKQKHAFMVALLCLINPH